MKRCSAVAIILAMSLPQTSQAIAFEFYKLTNAALPQPVGELYPNLPGPFANAGDWVGNPTLSYTVDGISVTANATYNGLAAVAVQDRETAWSATKGAGLGVYKPGAIVLSDDNIDLGEKLRLVFNQSVRVTDILLRANGHNFTNWTGDATFLFNGVSTPMPLGTGIISGNWVGTEFTFDHSGGLSDPTDNQPSHDYYVAALIVERVPDATVTLASLGASLLGLIGLRRLLR